MHKDDLFAFGKFDVEHALNIFAESYATFPADQMYKPGFIQPLKESYDPFHIYLIGYTPRVENPRFQARDGVLLVSATFMGAAVQVEFEIPEGFRLMEVGGGYYLENDEKQKIGIDPSLLRKEIAAAAGGSPFEVKYVGQAFGSDGSRDAIDRLLKHETLQKIAIKVKI